MIMFAKTFPCVLKKLRVEILLQKTMSSAADTVRKAQSIEEADHKYDTRLLRVAIIGTPNSGKSTFINNLMDRKVCATSSKVHTTRYKARAVFTIDDAQIVFIDTPGLVNEREKKKFNLEKTFLKDSENVVKNADAVGVIHDVTNTWTRERLDIKIIKMLYMNKKIPSFLVLNKVDILKSKRKLLDLTRQLTQNCINGEPIPGSAKLKDGNNTDIGWPNFQEVFMVSSLTGSGLAEVKNYLIHQAIPSKWMFPEQVWTDQDAEKIITNAVQAKLLDFLPQEIPYQLKPEIEYFDIAKNGVVSAGVIINSPSERVTRLVAGASDGKLKQITESLQLDLQNTFQNHVRLKLILKSKSVT